MIERGKMHGSDNVLDGFESVVTEVKASQCLGGQEIRLERFDLIVCQKQLLDARIVKGIVRKGVLCEIVVAEVEMCDGEYVCKDVRRNGHHLAMATRETDRRRGGWEFSQRGQLIVVEGD